LRKLKFGVFLPFYAFQAKTPYEYYDHLKTISLECEHLGYESVWLDDHLMYGNWPILETWVTLSALSALTSKIRLGTMVSCTMHRNPALLAKAGATFDVLSNGRLEFGIGAGVQKEEHVAYGFGFPPISNRVQRLDEALEVIRRLWTMEKANFRGKHYALKNAVCEPKPLQKPHPPIIVGGGGKDILKVTAKYADRFDWGSLPSINLYKRKLEALEKHCKMVGRDFSEIEKSCWPGGQVLIARDQKELSEKIYRLEPAGMSLEDFKRNVLAGTADECRERLQFYVNLGVTHFMLFFADLPKVDGLRLFAESVAKRMS